MVALYDPVVVLFDLFLIGATWLIVGNHYKKKIKKLQQSYKLRHGDTLGG